MWQPKKFRISCQFFSSELGALKIKNVRFITFKYAGINNDCFLSYLIFVIILCFVLTLFRFGLKKNSRKHQFHSHKTDRQNNKLLDGDHYLNTFHTELQIAWSTSPPASRVIKAEDVPNSCSSTPALCSPELAVSGCFLCDTSSFRGGKKWSVSPKLKVAVWWKKISIAKISLEHFQMAWYKVTADPRMLNIKLIWWQYALAKPFFLRSTFNLGINLDFYDEFSQTSQFLSSSPTTVQKQTCLCYSAGTEPISTSFIYTLCFIPAISGALILYASPHLPLCLSLFGCVCVRMRMCVSFLHIRTLFHFLAACLQRFIINSSNFLMFLLFLAFTWPQCPYLFSLPLAPLHLHHF